MQNTKLADMDIGLDRPPLHELVRGRLRDLIVRGNLPPGSNIAEVDLSERLGTSRTPLREALKLLQAEGLIELRSNRGAYVVPIDPVGIAEAFEIAAMLEQLGAAGAARRATKEQVGALATLQDVLEAEHAAGALEPYFAANQAIHRLIVAMSRNETLRMTHEMLFGRVERLRFAALRHQPRWDQSIDEHRAILRAIERRDARGAGAAMGRHVRRTGIAAHRALTALPGGGKPLGQQEHRAIGQHARALATNPTAAKDHP